MKKRCIIGLLGLLTIVRPGFGQELAPRIQESFQPLEVGEIRPEGWLRDWAETAARGITGSLDETGWPFTKGWGDARIPMKQGAPWWPYEQTGYYTDGLIRLAYVLGDSVLIRKAEAIIESVIARQEPSGYYFIDDDAYRDKWTRNDGDRAYQQQTYMAGMHWAIATFARGALAYYSATGDQRALDMLVKAYRRFPLFDRKREKYPISGWELQASRSLVNLEVMLETARYSGDEELLKRTLEIYALNESGMVDSWAHKQEFDRTAICHGVTYNELAKLYAAAYPWTGRSDYLAASVNAYDYLCRHFLLPNGVNSSNEYLLGRGAFEGAETCDIADFIWSNCWLARASGDARYGDRIERAFFNAFPAVVAPDFNEHLYECAVNRIPGLHLRYRDDGCYFKPMHWPVCCTGNLNRIIPNYLINMCMEDHTGRLMFLTYGPARIHTRDGRYDVRINTEYPFREQVILEIEAMPQDRTLLLRIPDWCREARCSINGTPCEMRIDDHGFLTLNHPWKRGDRINLTLPMRPEIETGVEEYALFKGKETYWGLENPAAPEYRIDGFRTGGRYTTLTYGPLLFALPLIGDNEEGFYLNEGSWQEFRYALSPDAASRVTIDTCRISRPFRWKKSQAPIRLTIPAARIHWDPDKGNPRLPESAPGMIEECELTLIPYGCARYRMAMFPALSENPIQ